MLTRFRAAGLMWPTLAMLPALVILIGLGVWQWQRMAWKTALVAQIEARAKEAPLTFEEAQKLGCNTGRRRRLLGENCEYRRVLLTGRFDHSGERHVFAGVHSVDRQSSVGWWVFTPFVPAGSNTRIFVNRGFLPDKLKAPASRRVGQPDGEIEIIAQIRSRTSRSWFDGENDPQKNVYYVRDPFELLGGSRPSKTIPKLGIATGQHYLEIIATPDQTGIPRPLAGTIAIPNRHFEYALTWWGLALTLVGVYGSFAWTRLRAVG